MVARIKSKSGFTLMEALACILIIAIVSDISLPAINNFHASERCKAEASQLVSYIRQAKYQAMQENSLYRLLFINTNYSYAIQKYIGTKPYVEHPDFSTAFDTIEVTDASWESVADTDEIEFNPSIEIEFNPSLATESKEIKVIYFKPDGYLYSSSTQLLSENNIVFKYGSAGVEVQINALGVISSEAISEENSNYFDDNYKASEDPDNDYE